MKRRQRALLLTVVLMCGLIGRPDQGRAASAFAGALEPTQIANFIQLIEHTIHFVQMVRSLKSQVESWKTTLKKLDPKHLMLAASVVTQGARLAKDFREITFGARANIEAFKKSHPGYKEPENYRDSYQQLDQSVVDASTRALQGMNAQMTDPYVGVEAQQKLIKELANAADSAEGELQAIRVTNQYLAQLNQIALQLLEVLTAHSQQMSHFIAAEAQRRSYERTAHDKIHKRTRPSSKSIDWSKDGLQGI